MKTGASAVTRREGRAGSHSLMNGQDPAVPDTQKVPQRDLLN